MDNGRASLIGCVLSFLGILSCVGMAQQMGENKLAITTQESDMVRAILISGPGDRLAIKDFLPKNEPGLTPFSLGGPQPATWLVVFRESTKGKYEILSNMTIFDPLDLLSGGQKTKIDFSRDLSDGTVIRFIGNVPIDPCTFDGVPDDPLTFTWAMRWGLVYLHGKGSLKWQDGAYLACNGDTCLRPTKDAPIPNDKAAMPPSTSPPAKIEPALAGTNFQEPKLIKKVEPIYPELARNAHVSGDVSLQISIDEKGDVSEISVVQGHPLLADAAINAVKQWKYSPALMNGKPVLVNVVATVTFKLK